MTGAVPPIRTAGPAPPQLRCHACQEPLALGARYCAACGASTAPTAPPSNDVSMRLGVGSGFRFGVGFFIAAALFGVISFLVSLLLAGSLVGLLLGGVATMTSTGASAFEGSGSARSEPFRLAGDVDVEWRATAPATPCHHRALVIRDERALAREAIVDQDIETTESGTYVLRGLVDAGYIIEVDSDCAWSFRLRPR